MHGFRPFLPLDPLYPCSIGGTGAGGRNRGFVLIYRDGNAVANPTETELVVEEAAFASDDVLTVPMSSGGGFGVVFEKVE